MSKLKPCPFCGGEAKVITIESMGKYKACVQCENCKAQTQWLWESVHYGAIAESETTWNKRQYEPTTYEQCMVD